MIPETPPDVRQVRRAFIEKHIDVRRAKIIEFGAFDYPTYSKAERNVTYVDFFSKAELAVLHNATRPERVKRAIEVDFVIKEVDFAPLISERFDLLIANHVFEHVPDAIRWLQNAEKILEPGTGRIFLAVPHKNYTFDLLRPVSRVTDIIVAHEERLQSPSLQQLFESLYFYRPVSVDHVWADDGTLAERLLQARYPNARAAWENAKVKLAHGGRLDVHCHVFTLESAISLFQELKKADYTNLEVLDAVDVLPSMNEFHLLLG
jgi:SAM-dependent methyltransferase